MYCPNCGNESTIGLKYCKNCGFNLTEMAQSAPPPASNILPALILATATVGIVLGGLSIIFNQTISLIGPQGPGMTPPTHDATVVAGLMVLFGSAAILLSTFLLIRLFSRVMGFGSASAPTAWPAKALQAANWLPQIQSRPVAMQSVTEHTTRNFEPRVRQRGDE
jgi:hypothetical protein